MLVTVTEAAKQLGISAEHARRMIRAGKWPVYRLGLKATRMDLEELRALARLVSEIESERKIQNYMNAWPGRMPLRVFLLIGTCLERRV